MRFRLVTYNIHKGIGGDRRYRLDRVVDVLRHCHADVALLQEVDEGVPRSRSDCQVELLAEALDFPHHAFQRNVYLKTGHYGNAILSRFPLLAVEDIDLTVPLKKRRRALAVRCRQRWEGHTRTLQLVNLHLGLSGFERKIQLRRLLRHEELQHGQRLPLVIGGDYNDVWDRLAQHVMRPAGLLLASGNIRTFPSRMPMRPLDRLFYRGNLRVNHVFAVHTNVAREASDHLPLVADFEWT